MHKAWDEESLSLFLPLMSCLLSSILSHSFIHNKWFPLSVILEWRYSFDNYIFILEIDWLVNSSESCFHELNYKWKYFANNYRPNEKWKAKALSRKYTMIKQTPQNILMNIVYYLYFRVNLPSIMIMFMERLCSKESVE